MTEINSTFEYDSLEDCFIQSYVLNLGLERGMFLGLVLDYDYKIYICPMGKVKTEYKILQCGDVGI